MVEIITFAFLVIGLFVLCKVRLQQLSDKNKSK